jgi:hypothetical protein
MLPPRRSISTLGVLLLAALAALALLPAAAGAWPAIKTTHGDMLVPGFRWDITTYGARCGGDGLSLRIDGARGWRTALRHSPPRAGDFAGHLSLDAGEAVRVTFVRRRDGERQVRWIRCLPEDMPPFDFDRVRRGGPRFFTVQMSPNYAVVMSRAGAPVWWLASADLPFDATILPDGTVGWNGGGQGGVVDHGIWEQRTLTGRLLRSVTSSTGGVLDVHDHLTLPNGNDLVGAPTFAPGDASRFGGSADAQIRHTAIEELTPDGELVRSWDSGDHIGLGQTPDRWWQRILASGGTSYDVSHWNAVEVDGRFMYLSFRHLDAVYKVNRRTGRIVWKLGGTETRKSLEVRGDPRGEDPLNGQHDVRLLDDGTITVYDNSTLLARPPRAVRYRIAEERGVARMVEQLIDPRVAVSVAGGSARRLDDGWLVSWAVSSPCVVGFYDGRGRPVFRLTYSRGATYRAIEVPREVSGVELRRAMNRMQPAG